MKTSLTLFALAVFAVSAGAQTTAQDAATATESAQASAANSTASASAAQATAVSAVLNKRIDSKSAKVGDEVTAKTTSEARFADGTKIPKGSRLVGHVTAVEPRSKDNRDGHVAFCFDHAQLKGGQEMTVSVLMHSIAAPAALSASAMDAEDPMGGGGGGLGGGGGSMPSRGGGGAVGGAAAGAGGAVRGAGGVAGNTVGGLAANTEPAIGATTNTMGNASATLGRDTAGMAGMAGASGSFAGPVANLPGVSFMTVNAGGDAGGNAAANGASATAGTSTATMLTAHNSNVSLDSGSQMTMAISAQH